MTAVKDIVNFFLCLWDHDWKFLSRFTSAMKRPGFPNGGWNLICARCGKLRYIK